MKKTFKKILILILVFTNILGLTVFAASSSGETSGYCGKNVTWKLSDNGTLTISGSGKMYDYSNTSNNFAPWMSPRYKKTKIIIGEGITYIGSYAFNSCTSMTSVTIPDSVTDIGSGAFYKCISIEDITLPDSVKNISDNAFANCSGLKNINIPDSVKTIGDSAFKDCESLSAITIPHSVTEIGNGAFVGCDSLTNITVIDNDIYASLDGILTNKDKTEIILYPIGKTDKSYTVPDGITTIGAYSFENCQNLTSITLSDSVISIGACAFENCTNLTNVTLSNNLSSIGDQAFYYCKKLKSIAIPNSVTLLGKNAFGYCSNLTDITLSDNITVIYESTFYECSSLTSIIIPKNVTTIGDRAFENCVSLYEITLPVSLVSVGADAFSLTNISQVEYNGTIEQWENIDMGLYNDVFKEADIIYSIEEEEPLEKLSSGKTVKVVIGSTLATVEADGNESIYTMDTAPYIQPESSSTLVPLRFVTVAIYGNEVDDANSSDIVSWDANTKTATINADDNTITFTVGNDYMTVNGENITMSNGVKAEITDGRLFIPFRALGEALGVSVDWDASTKTAIYTSGI